MKYVSVIALSMLFGAAQMQAQHHEDSNFATSQQVLNVALANHGVLLFQTLNYHWNIVGKQFNDYHTLFKGQYTQLFSSMDLLAERVRAVQGVALGSMQEFVKHATIKEDTGATPKPKEMIKKLLGQYERMIAQLRESIAMLEKGDDFGTRKMLEDLLEIDEKTAWMLRSLAHNHKSTK